MPKAILHRKRRVEKRMMARLFQWVRRSVVLAHGRHDRYLRPPCVCAKCYSAAAAAKVPLRMRSLPERMLIAQNRLQVPTREQRDFEDRWEGPEMSGGVDYEPEDV